MVTVAERYTDLKVVQDPVDGIFDLVIDPDTKDFEVVDGLESSIIASLFSDRRAAPDEVADPIRRRGWIGNLVAEVPGDNFGSGLWLYEQKRLTQDVVTGLRVEAEQSLDWMIDEGLVREVTAKIVAAPEKRAVYLFVEETSPHGGVTRRAFRLIEATQRGVIAQIGTFQGGPVRRDARTGLLEWDGEILSWEQGEHLGWDA